MAIIEDLSEEEACLLAILTDHSGLDLAEKTCRSCGVSKPLDAFPPRRDSKDGRRSDCRECKNTHHRGWMAGEKSVKYRRAYKAANRERIRDYMYVYQRTVVVQRKYGVTAEEIAAQVAEQEGRCPGCDEPLPEKSDVDHDHGSGEVRGILCPRCNRALGLVRDSVATLLRLATYLEKGGVWRGSD